MAYVVDDKQEEKEEGMSVFGGDYKQSPASTTSAPSTGGTASQAVKEPARQGTGFTNLRQYIEANKPQAQQLSQAIVKGTQKEADKLKTDITEKGQLFDTGLQSEQARISAGQDVTNQALSQAQAGQQLSDEDLAKFQALRKGTGSFEDITTPDYAKFSQQGKDLQNLGRNVGTTAGRFQLLEQSLGRPTYSRGQKTLDELVLAGTKPARQATVSGIRQATDNIGKAASTQQEINRQALLNLRRQAGEVSDYSQEQIDANKTALEESLAAKLEAAQTDKYAGLREGLTGDTRALTQEQLDYLGIEGNNLYDVDPSSYLYNQPTINQLSSQEELDRAEALSALGEQPQDLILDPDEVGTYEEKSQAGLEGLREAVAARKAKAESMRANFLARYNPIQQHYVNVLNSSIIDKNAVAAKYGRQAKAIRDQYTRELAGEFGERGITGGIVGLNEEPVV